MDWKEIDTAPKDGTSVWLYGIDDGGDERGVLAFWPIDDDADGWYEFEAASYPVSFVPTHWATFTPPDAASVYRLMRQGS